MDLSDKYPVTGLTEDSVVIDVGAFQGKWCREIIKRYNCKCYLFEPTKKFADLLKAQYEQNAKIQVISKALTDTVGKRTLHCKNNNLSNSFYVDRKYKNKPHLKDLVVKTVDLDWFFERYDEPVIDAMKINAEGSEIDIFRGMKREHAERIRKIYWAAHDHQFYYGPDVGAMLSKLVSLGYRIEQYFNGKGKISNRYLCEFEG